MPASIINIADHRRPETITELPGDDRIARAFKFIDSSEARFTAELIRICEIPAPPFKEQERGRYFAARFAELGLADVHTDSEGNVIGFYRGESEEPLLVMSAHLDTVFPAGTDVTVRRDKSRMTAPGISDNGAGLAALVAIARAIHEARIQPQRSILFAANVGEEGEGNLRGMRALVEAYRDRLKGVIVLDGSSVDHVTAKALASRRLEVVISGPGGHSWSDFGIPNPINALVRGSVRFISTRVPSAPRTTFNLGEIEGGTSVNSVPHEARLKVDLRSESDDELTRLETALRECVTAGVRDEMESSRDRSKGKLEWKLETLGNRPGGELAANSPLLAALRAADEFVGNQSRVERASTDANIPLSLGIDAIAIGAGGNGGGAHSLQEWYESDGRENGLKRVLLTLLGSSGLASEKSR